MKISFKRGTLYALMVAVYSPLAMPQRVMAQDTTVGCKNYDQGCAETAKNILVAEGAVIIIAATLMAAEVALAAKAIAETGIVGGTQAVAVWCIEHN